jgi:hypothetical protein
MSWSNNDEDIKAGSSQAIYPVDSLQSPRCKEAAGMQHGAGENCDTSPRSHKNAYLGDFVALVTALAYQYTDKTTLLPLPLIHG